MENSDENNPNHHKNNDDLYGPPANKRERLDDSQNYYQQTSQGTSFGLNFVTYQEYQALKMEHDLLKQDFANMKVSMMAELQTSFFTQINAIQKENSQLKEEVSKLKRKLEEGPNKHDSTTLNGSCEGDQSMAEQVKTLTADLVAVKAMLSTPPPVPGKETISYMKSVLDYYLPKPSVKPPLPATAPLLQASLSAPGLSTVPSLPTAPTAPTLPTLPTSLELASNGSLPPPPPPPPQATQPQLINPVSAAAAAVAGALGVTSSASTPSLSDLGNPADDSLFGLNPSNYSALQKLGPPTCPVLLVPGRDIFVDGRQLTSVLRMTETRGGDDLAQFLLRRVIMLVFTVEELAYSRGQGIMSSTSLDTPHRRPLDPEKVAACKEFMKKWCFDHNLEEPSEKAINTVITHQITYSRTKLKRMANKLKESDASANIPATFDMSQYLPKEGEEDSTSQFSIKEEVMDNDYNTQTTQ